jgi:hypothetical protein
LDALVCDSAFDSLVQAYESGVLRKTMVLPGLARFGDVKDLVSLAKKNSKRLLWRPGKKLPPQEWFEVLLEK